MRAVLRRAALAATALLATMGVAAQNAPLVVGAALPQSGLFADLAADYRKGLVLWQELANARGGLLGRRIELRLVDDRSESGAAATLYDRLIDEEQADLLIGPFGSAATLGAAASAERARRVLINATGTARAPHRSGTKYVFQLTAPPAAHGAAVAAFAREQGYTRLYVLARSDPVSIEMANRTVELAQQGGASAGALDRYGPGTQDFDAQVARARERDAQAWIGFGTPLEAAGMVKTLKRLEYAPALFVAQGAADPAFVRTVGQDAEHAIAVSAWERNLDTRGNASFVAAYVARWSAEPGLAAAQGYSAGRLLEEAAQRAGSLAQESMRQTLATLETETPLGAYRVDPRSGAQLGAQPVLVQIVAGRREIVWPAARATARATLPYPRWENRKPIAEKR